MNSIWQKEFQNRMKNFQSMKESSENDFAVSIKIRVDRGCFHRSCCPNAYKMIDDKLKSMLNNYDEFVFEEHETGPEILVYLTLAAAGVSLASNVIALINTIIKARFEGQKKGDNHRDPIEIIIRRVDKKGEFLEETILKINSLEEYSSSEMEMKLNNSAEKLVKKKVNKKRN
jgi:hypothetical protein